MEFFLGVVVALAAVALGVCLSKALISRKPTPAPLSDDDVELLIAAMKAEAARRRAS